MQLERATSWPWHVLSLGWQCPPAASLHWTHLSTLHGSAPLSFSVSCVLWPLGARGGPCARWCSPSLWGAPPNPFWIAPFATPSPSALHTTQLHMSVLGFSS